MRAFGVAVLVLAGSLGAGEKPKTHPHFNDGGAIPWFTELAAASSAAKKQGKLVFIEYGREK